MKKVFYFGLEPLKARYTYQLSKEWMPATFEPYSDKVEFIDVEGEFDPDQQIKVGAVLDAVGRGKFAMSQCSNFLDMLNNDKVRNGDVIFLQDYWHPGIESILYALDLYGHLEMTLAKYPDYDPTAQKKPIVVYSSRLDKEKNPFFMMEVAKKYLNDFPAAEWHVTTSGKEFKSMLPGVIEALYKLADELPNFKLLKNLTKQEYYKELAEAKIQFNSSLQDYVSWTVLESTAFGCDMVFPNFRSFPEFIPSTRLYTPFNVSSAVIRLHEVMRQHQPNYNIAYLADLGRQMEGYIVANGIDQEINIWHEAEYCKHLLNKNKE